MVLAHLQLHRQFAIMIASIIEIVQKYYRNISLRLYDTRYIVGVWRHARCRSLTQSASRCDRWLCTYSVTVYKRCPYKLRGRYAYTAGTYNAVQGTRAMHLLHVTLEPTLIARQSSLRWEERNKKEDKEKKIARIAMCGGRNGTRAKEETSKRERPCHTNKESVKRDADERR